jgi:hypothetical protein
MGVDLLAGLFFGWYIQYGHRARRAPATPLPHCAPPESPEIFHRAQGWLFIGRPSGRKRGSPAAPANTKIRLSSWAYNNASIQYIMSTPYTASRRRCTSMAEPQYCALGIQHVYLVDRFHHRSAHVHVCTHHELSMSCRAGFDTTATYPHLSSTLIIL